MEQRQTLAERPLLVVVGDPSLRQEVCGVAGAAARIAVAQNAASAREALASDPHLAGLIVEDELPDGSGTELVAELRAAGGDDVPALVLVAHEDPPVAPARVRAASVWKGERPARLRYRMERFGRTAALGHAMRAACDRLADELSFTPRERDLARASLFLDRRDLASALGVSESRTKELVRAVLARTGGRSLADLFEHAALEVVLERVRAPGRCAGGLAPYALLVEGPSREESEVCRLLAEHVPVRLARTGAAACGVLAGPRPPAGLIVQDALPDGSGLDLLRRVRHELALATPALLLSTRSREELPASPARLGATLVWNGEPRPRADARLRRFAVKVAVSAALRRAAGEARRRWDLGPAERELIEAALFLARDELARAVARSESSVRDRLTRVLDASGAARLDEVCDLRLLEAASSRRLSVARPSAARRPRIAARAPRRRVVAG